MKKTLLALVFMFGFSNTFALSCIQPEPLPSLEKTANNYKTIGLLEVISFETEDFIKLKAGQKPLNRTAEGKFRKYTTHQVKWKNLIKGEENTEEFLLRINATSWMGNPTILKPGNILPITTNAILDKGVLTLDQDFGCGRSDWNRYSEEDVLNLKETGIPEKTEYIGKTVEESLVVSKNNNTDFRVVSIDGKPLPVTMDWRPGRINATVENNIVISYNVEGQEKTIEPKQDLYIGKALDEAQKIAQEKNTRFRIVNLDNKPQPTTKDYRPGRINATVKNNIVVSYDIEGEKLETKKPITKTEIEKNSWEKFLSWFNSLFE